MATQHKKLDTFTVVGISVRTINLNGQSRTDMTQLWGNFMRENLLAKIPNKISDDIYCVYTDYESDYLGVYTAILGCKVSSTENLPEGFISKKIPASRYQVYTSKGKVFDVVGKTWENIWASEIKRKYAADFDVYGKKATNPEDAEVETFVSIKD